MKLAALLAALPDDELERLAAEHVRTDDHLPRGALCHMLEGTLRSFRFVQEFVVNRQPPAFAMLTTLLDAADFALPAAGFRDAVMAETARLCDLVGRGEIVGRDDQLRLYRRVLHEARRSDLEIDASESAILGVLRRELDIRPVEHFLIEHHPDLQEFWNNERAFLHELTAMRSAGLIFVHDGQTLLAEEVVPLVRHAIGVDMSRKATRQLYEQLSGADLSEALQAARVRASGTKEEKIDRLLSNMVQPREVLRSVALVTLRDLCRTTGAQTSGSKDELVERLAEHFAQGLHDRPPEEVPPPPPPEPRALDERRFRSLFAELKGHELTNILSAVPGARTSGTKETKIAALLQTPLSEASLLMGLTNRDIEDVLDRLRLKLGGAKRERIERIVEHFRTLPDAMLQVGEPAPSQDDDASAPAGAPLVAETTEAPALRPDLPEEGAAGSTE